MNKLWFAFFLVSAIVAVCYGQEQEGFSVSSSDFEDGKPLDRKFRMTDHSTAEGHNISPQISWKNSPIGTKFFAVTFIDSHPMTHKWVHWMVVNIPAATNEIPESASMSKMPEGATETKNSYGKKGYGGPQPAKGSVVHKYILTVYALSDNVIAEGFLSENAFLKLVSGKVLAKASIIGTFEHISVSK